MPPPAPPQNNPSPTQRSVSPVAAGALSPAPPSLADAEAYCRRVSQHYENFSVVSWLLPRRLRQHFFNLYAYCRHADDLADESPSPSVALQQLQAWRQELNATFQGQPTHPIMVALATTVREFGIPQAPLADLITAFEQDQTQWEYATHADVLGYCRYSANPVGRLVLYLAECHDQVDLQAADHLCTGLQLANFCQDVGRDFTLGRVYLPLEGLARHGIPREELGAPRATPRFRKLLEEEVLRAEEYLHRSHPLLTQVPRFLQVDLKLFQLGGLSICQAIRRQQFDVLKQRPVVSKSQKAWLMVRAWASQLFTARPQGASQSLSERGSA